MHADIIQEENLTHTK